VFDQRGARLAARRGQHLVREQVGGDVLEVRDDLLRRAAATLRGLEQGARVRRGGASPLEQPGLEVERLPVGRVARRPAAGGGECHDGVRAAARGELKRDVAAERVSHEVGALEPDLVQRALDRVG
jgi:hypothetical protein